MMHLIPKDPFALTLVSRTDARRVLILADNKVHDLEFFYPYYRFSEAGFTVDVATPEGKPFTGEYGMAFQQVKPVADVKPSHYEMLFIPGGKAPATLRESEAVLAVVREFARLGISIAAFCHGPQVLISAGVVQGKSLTAWPKVEDEIVEAGGIYVDEPVVRDGGFITSRWPGDLPAHMSAVLEKLSTEAKGSRAA